MKRERFLTFLDKSIKKCKTIQMRIKGTFVLILTNILPPVYMISKVN